MLGLGAAGAVEATGSTVVERSAWAAPVQVNVVTPIAAEVTSPTPIHGRRDLRRFDGAATCSGIRELKFVTT
jgi:hypothetical protein